MSKVYVVMEYIYNTEGSVVGNDLVAAYETEDTAIDFMDTFRLGDEIVEVELGWPLDAEFAESSKVVYSTNYNATAQVLSEFFAGKRGKKR